jgi:hypothetical protein
LIRRAAASRPLRRAAFWLYALAIATLTHWPGLAVETPFEFRADIFVHSGVFACWTVLLALCGYFGTAREPRNVTTSMVVALVYTAVDEFTQGIPGINRSVDPLDLLANILGVILAGLGLRLLAARRDPP